MNRNKKRTTKFIKELNAPRITIVKLGKTKVTINLYDFLS